MTCVSTMQQTAHSQWQSYTRLTWSGSVWSLLCALLCTLLAVSTPASAIRVPVPQAPVQLPAHIGTAPQPAAVAANGVNADIASRTAATLALMKSLEAQLGDHGDHVGQVQEIPHVDVVGGSKTMKKLEKRVDDSDKKDPPKEEGEDDFENKAAQPEVKLSVVQKASDLMKTEEITKQLEKRIQQHPLTYFRDDVEISPDMVEVYREDEHPQCPENYCSEHGACRLYDVHDGKNVFICICDDNFTGDHCDIEVLSERCKANIHCVNHCSCRGVCHGLTDTAVCMCDLGWAGEDCSKVAQCPDNCSGHGLCDDRDNQKALCHCLPGWVGVTCETPVEKALANYRHRYPEVGQALGEFLQVGAVVGDTHAHTPDVVGGVDGVTNDSYRQLLEDHNMSGLVAGGGDTVALDTATADWQRAAMSSSFLIVHILSSGALATWNKVDRRLITYCFSENVGSRLPTARKAFKEATDMWEAACGVNFEEVSFAKPSDCHKYNEDVSFNIATTEHPNVPYEARAFFPFQARHHRELVVRSKVFSDALYARAIFLHELGHVLGLRHEHTREEANHPKCYEDDNWKSLTDYDDDSVMNYPQCGGVQDPFKRPHKYVLSADDKKGSRALYGPPLSTNGKSQPDDDNGEESDDVAGTSKKQHEGGDVAGSGSGDDGDGDGVGDDASPDGEESEVQSKQNKSSDKTAKNSKAKPHKPSPPSPSPPPSTKESMKQDIFEGKMSEFFQMHYYGPYKAVGGTVVEVFLQSSVSNETLSVGDVDLFVKFDVPASTVSFDCRPYNLFGSERCKLVVPGEDDTHEIHIAIQNWSASSHYTGFVLYYPPLDARNATAPVLRLSPHVETTPTLGHELGHYHVMSNATNGAPSLKAMNDEAHDIRHNHKNLAVHYRSESAIVLLPGQNDTFTVDNVLSGMPVSVRVSALPGAEFDLVLAFGDGGADNSSSSSAPVSSTRSGKGSGSDQHVSGTVACVKQQRIKTSFWRNHLGLKLVQECEAVVPEGVSVVHATVAASSKSVYQVSLDCIHNP
eukprot:GFYU01007543.1.p1 GENE.GFYU01007543.1~~GFYU01007543.1.p1  ORF type:complete len:1029 (-),score=277.66 GFYU01007543.1:1612-4698(-)